MNMNARGSPISSSALTVIVAGDMPRRRTPKKTADFAELMRELVDAHYPEAERIRVVLNNYSTHQPASLYRAFPGAGGAAFAAQTGVSLHP